MAAKSKSRPSSGRPRRREEPATKAPLSIRMTDRERALIDDAAKAKGVSTSQLVRDAARRRALDVLNAQTAASALENVADRIAQVLVDPEITVRGFDPEARSDVSAEFTRSFKNSEKPLLAYREELGMTTLVEHVEVTAINERQILEAADALETASSEIALLIAKRLRALLDAGKDVYQPSAETRLSAEESE